LAHLTGFVEDSGEGRWTLQEAVDRSVPVPTLAAALFTRFRSRGENPFAERLLAALRKQFGGHAVRTHD
jgi:6-phosphogluconate dehydrogenase